MQVLCFQRSYFKVRVCYKHNMHAKLGKSDGKYPEKLHTNLIGFRCALALERKVCVVLCLQKEMMNKQHGSMREWLEMQKWKFNLQTTETCEVRDRTSYFDECCRLFQLKRWHSWFKQTVHVIATWIQEGNIIMCWLTFTEGRAPAAVTWVAQVLALRSHLITNESCWAEHATRVRRQHAWLRTLKIF